MAVSNTYSAKEIKKLMLISFKKYQSGAISETQAYRENTMLANILRAIESSEQEARLEALEQAILKTRNEA
jgi:hypothetical protein